MVTLRSASWSTERKQLSTSVNGYARKTYVTYVKVPSFSARFVEAHRRPCELSPRWRHAALSRAARREVRTEVRQRVGAFPRASAQPESS